MLDLGGFPAISLDGSDRTVRGDVAVEVEDLRLELDDAGACDREVLLACTRFG